VSDPDLAWEALLGERLLEVAELANRPDDLDAVVAADGQSRRIITPVFQPPKPIEQDRRSLFATYVTDDSAHGLTLVDGTTRRTGSA
jgi:hypothetical protein